MSKKKLCCVFGQLNQVRLDQKKKCFSGLGASYCHGGLPNTRQKIELKVKEIEQLKESLYELYASRKPVQRKGRDEKCSLNDQVSSVIHTLLFMTNYLRKPELCTFLYTSLYLSYT